MTHNSKLIPLNKPSMIIKRHVPDDHYEVHYRDRVEFWDVTLSVKLGESGVEPVE